MAPEVLNICVLGVMFFLGFLLFFCRFPSRVISPSKIRNLFFKGFISHFLEFGFKFVASSVIYSSAVWFVSYLPDWNRPSIFGYKFLNFVGYVICCFGGSLFGLASLAACWSKVSMLFVSSSISSCSLNYTDRFTLLLSFVCKYPSLFLRCASVRLVFWLLLMCLMLLLLESGPRLSRNLIVCLCMLRRLHWLQRNLVDPGFCFR